MWICRKCHCENPENSEVCQGCGERHAKSFGAPQAPQQRPATNEPRPKRRVSAINYDGRPGLALWLEVFGWILLVGGILAAIICFFNLTYAENEIVGLFHSRTEKVFSWPGFIISVGVLLSSVFGFLCARGLSQLVWDSSTTKSLTMQMYDKVMNDD